MVRHFRLMDLFLVRGRWSGPWVNCPPLGFLHIPIKRPVKESRIIPQLTLQSSNQPETTVCFKKPIWQIVLVTDMKTAHIAYLFGNHLMRGLVLAF